MAIGVPAATIARMRREGVNPTVASLEPLLDFFRIDMDTLLYKDISCPEYQSRKKSGNLVHVPVSTIEDIRIGLTSNSKISKFVGSAGITSENVFGIEIGTDALAPAFQNKSIVIIDPDISPKEGDYVLCCLDNDKTPVFRQIFIDGSNHYFKPINPGFGEMRHVKNFEIKGVVIKSIESFR